MILTDPLNWKIDSCLIVLSDIIPKFHFLGNRLAHRKESKSIVVTHQPKRNTENGDFDDGHFSASIQSAHRLVASPKNKNSPLAIKRRIVRGGQYWTRTSDPYRVKVML